MLQTASVISIARNRSRLPNWLVVRPFRNFEENTPSQLDMQTARQVGWMPGFFTHIYPARRVADHLLNGEFPDWPDMAGALDAYDANTCGTIMQKWEKFTHLGAIGPDMFYYSQDWNN